MKLLSKKQFLLLSSIVLFSSSLIKAENFNTSQIHIESLKAEKTFFFYVAIILSLFVIMLIFYIQASLTKKRKENKKLQVQNKEIKTNYATMRKEMKKLENKCHNLVEAEYELRKQNKNLKEELDREKTQNILSIKETSLT